MGTFRREKGRKEQNSSTREKTREDRNVAGKKEVRPWATKISKFKIKREEPIP